MPPRRPRRRPRPRRPPRRRDPPVRHPRIRPPPPWRPRSSPSTSTPYEWLNPAAGPEEADGPTPPVDVAQAISLAFAAPEGGTEGGGLVGYPSTAWAWIDGTEVPVAVASAGSGKRLRLDTSGWTDDDGTRDAVTIVWQVGPDSLAWRSTTVAA